MYKILVISDTHQGLSNVIDLINDIDDIDHIFHLGDLVRDAEDIASMVDIPVDYVAGNCDFLSSQVPDVKVVEIQGKQFFLTHGHEYGVKYSLDRLANIMVNQEYDCALFGHTHIQYMEFIGKRLIMNPGSISLPRDGNEPSFGIIQIDESGCLHGTLNKIKKS